MRTPRSVRDDLERLDDTLHTVRRSSDSPAVAMMASGLDEIRETFATELDELRRPRLDVVLDGDPVIGHEVRIDALADVLHSLQESVSSVAQALTGKATARAQIPGPLRDRTALRLASVYPGSFGAVLRGPAPEEDASIPTMDFAEEVPTLLDDAVDKVLTLVDLANSDDVNDDPIIDLVLPLGPRAFKHLIDLSSAVVSQEFTASFKFVSPSAEPHDATLTHLSAQRLSDALGRNRMTERQEVITGHLGTVSDIRNRVELQPDEGPIIRATVIDELVPQLAAYYTHTVDATFDVTIVRSQVTGLERMSYLLVGLAFMNDGQDELPSNE